MRKLIPILLVLLFAISVFANSANFEEYVDVIKKEYSKKNDEMKQTWKTGVKLQYDYTLDHVATDFEFVKGKVTEDNKVIISGICITTGFCYTKNNQKIRIIQMVGIAILMNQDKKAEKFVRITDYKQSTLPGWGDTEVKIAV